MSTALVRLGDYFDPVAGVIPSGVLASDSISNTVTVYNNSTDYTWHDTYLQFNNQGQKWEQDVRATFSGPQTYNGMRQVSTNRYITAPAIGFTNSHYNHVGEFEFIFTGTRFSIVHYNSGGNGTGTSYGGDVKMYLEYGGRMWKASENPLTTTRTDGYAAYRNVTFEAPYCGRIRLVFGNAAFYSVRTDTSSIIAPSPPRMFGIADGDSYFEPSQALDADSVTGWFTSGNIDFLFEKTGICFARRAEGATGFFANGVTQVFDDTPGSATASILGFISVTEGNFSRWLSADRVGWMTQASTMQAARGSSPFINYPGEDFGQPPGLRPVVYILNGTWNDASVGGVSSAVMEARALWCYQWLRALDPLCTFAHVSPEPFNDTLFGDGAAIGPPRDGDKSDIHLIGQMAAVAQVARTRYINGFGPDTSPPPWWTGDGPNPASGGAQNVPTNSPQAQLCSVHDGIHGTKWMYDYYASKIVEQLAEMMVPAARVNGEA